MCEDEVRAILKYDGRWLSKNYADPFKRQFLWKISSIETIQEQTYRQHHSKNGLVGKRENFKSNFYFFFKVTIRALMSTGK